MMTTIHTALPKWILILSGIFALMELLVSVSICLSPESVLETVDLNARGVEYLVYLWASRQFALGCIFAFATMKKSVPMLTLAYLFFLVMFMGDFFIGISQNENSLVISALVMCAISAGMLFVLHKKNNTGV
jgi:hypothetical protein